jgi:uncharacterized SAM-dependent methyltransferase
MDSSRLKLIAVDERDTSNDFAAAVKAGLSRKPKQLPCRFFYDEEGSRIFEEICELPEYYLTRAEHEILSAHADEIAAGFGRRAPASPSTGAGAIRSNALRSTFWGLRETRLDACAAGSL